MVLSLSALRRSSKSRSPHPRPAPVRSSSAHSTLTEALRNNPFRVKSSESLPEDVVDEVKEINIALLRLAELFPDVQIEVIRELLVRFNGDSRLEMSAEQLYRYKAEWARGRLQAPPRDLGDHLLVEELFRSTDYIAGVKKTLGLEFRGLGKSAIDAVLAEVNNSYGRARPILQGLAAKSWRFAITNFFKKRPQDDLPTCLFVGRRVDLIDPTLVASGSIELDVELQKLLIDPLQKPTKQNLDEDYEYAQTVNQQEAEEMGALYECQCCYNEVPFEDIATCDFNTHVMCFDCVRRTMQEALFGQGWSKSVDISRSSLFCLASTSDPCGGCIPAPLVERAVRSSKSGNEIWIKFEARLIATSLLNSNLKVLSCPFCPYVEAEHTPTPDNISKTMKWRRDLDPLQIMLVLLVLPWLIGLLLVLKLIIPKCHPLCPRVILKTSLTTLALRNRPIRFRCRNPSCSRPSCLKCKKAWHDPHICHEPLLQSLRTSIEAARTAAVKRTCPRCGTGFVKSSGCNKLTCVCGYSMCYLCRQALGKSAANLNPFRGGAAAAADATADGEGYTHYCPHFRPLPGRPCTECQRCDLYRNDDEDLAVRRAGVEAERLWRIREGMVGVGGLEEAVRNAGRRKEDGVMGMVDAFVNGEWTVQGVVDWVVGKCFVVDER